MNCKWDNETGTYTVDGEKCRKDEFGFPTNHCTARRTCSNHIGLEELTCPRCLGRTRMDLRQIVQRSAELLPEALESGITSEAAWLAGPATDTEAWSWHKAAAKRAQYIAELTGQPATLWHVSLIEDDDDYHPFTVLTRWAWMTVRAYDLPEPDVWTITNAADLIDRQLGRIAQDKGNDFNRLATELRKCRSRVESALRDSTAPERGAPCPTCGDDRVFVRLVREYAHWCDNPTCTQQFHATTDDFDVWVCPRNNDHWWTVGGFAEEQRERTSA